MTQDILQITQAYFEASNQADLKRVQSMFMPDATYSSAHTGLYYGVTDIMSMMTAFFQLYQDLHWQIDELRKVSDHITEVLFTCRLTDQEGQVIERTGIERLVVVDGLIKHIEIRQIN